MAETLKVYMARVFSAIDIEDEKLRDELIDVRDRIDLGFNPVSNDRMHLTLQFFKDINEEEIEKLKAAMDNVKKESFEATMKGVGCFPSRDYIRVVWAGFEEEEDIRELYLQLSQHDVKPDNSYRFKPHVTLMRVNDVGSEEKKKLQRTVREFEDHVFGEMEIDKIKLYRSELVEGGSRYTELYSREI